MRFAAITDLHFGPAEPFRGVNRKLTGQAPALTAAFVDDMNLRVRPDFVIVLGDVIEDQSPHADLANYSAATNALSKLHMPVRHLYGNHDLVNLSHRQLLALTGEPALNSSFDVGGWHLVRLHSTAELVPASQPGAPAELRGSIAPEHLRWLDNDLAATDKPTIVFTHFSPADQDLTDQFWFDDSPAEALLANRAELRSLLEAHGVVMTLNGHVHWNDHTVHNGISYITVQSLVENATGEGEPAAAWALIETGPERIDITVHGRDPATFQVHRPSPRSHAEPRSAAPRDPVTEPIPPTAASSPADTPDSRTRRPAAILFDWNGTLVDDFERARRASNDVRRRWGLLPDLPVDDFRRAWCLPLADHMSRLGVPDAHSDAAVAAWNTGIAQVGAPLQPGTVTALEALQQAGTKLAVVTAAAGHAIERDLSDHDLGGYFAAIHADTADKAAVAAAYVEKARPGTVWYVGDTAFDMLHARRAGAIAVGFTGGYHTPDQLQKAGAHHLIDDLTELTGLAADTHGPQRGLGPGSAGGPSMRSWPFMQPMRT